MARRQRKTRRVSRSGTDYDGSRDTVLYAVEYVNPTAYKDTEKVIEISVRRYGDTQPKVAMYYIPYPGSTEVDVRDGRPTGEQRRKLGRLTAKEAVIVVNGLPDALMALREWVHDNQPDDVEQKPEQSKPKSTKSKRKISALGA